jgi:hypothetical protein
VLLRGLGKKAPAARRKAAEAFHRGRDDDGGGAVKHYRGRGVAAQFAKLSDTLLISPPEVRRHRGGACF